MHGSFDTLIIVSGASAAFTALVFGAMYVAFRSGLAGRTRGAAVADTESDCATPYFGRIN